MYKILWITSLLWGSIVGATWGQYNFTTPKNASEKTKSSYKKAYQYLTQKDWVKTEKELLKIIKKDPNFVTSYLLMSDICLQKKDTAQAILHLNKAIEIAPDYDPRTYLSLARIAMNKADYSEAVIQADIFLTYSNAHKNLKKIAAKIKLDARYRPYALSHPVPFNPINLGENINSAARDYFPSITLHNELVYTVQIDLGRGGQEDLYRSKKEADGWSKSEAMVSVNTPDNEGAQSISADGRLLVFTVCNRRGDFGSCDLYFSKKVNNQWTKPQNMGSAINTKNWESQPSIAPNSDAIYFVRGGARGSGNKDLYIVRLQEDGSWGKPQKIDELNTPYNESSPCIHPDGQTLYFSSAGHAGLGNLDLFVSRMQPNGQWGTPLNLGYPINTAAAEEALAVSLKGDVAYLASDREGGFGSLDIYSFELPQNVRPKPVTYIKGITKNAATGLPLSAFVEIIDLKSKKRYTKLTTKKDGQFTICLPLGEYALNAHRPQYAFFSANYDLNQPKMLDKAYQLVANLQPINSTEKQKKHEPIILENVFFETASAELKAISKVELDKLKDFLEENAALKIQLNGHTDNVGKEEDNLILSQKRAAAVREYLIQNGIAADRMTSKGFGESLPIQPNEEAKGRAKNRRTEFLIIE